jgi:hypothetical protein
MSLVSDLQAQKIILKNEIDPLFNTVMDALSLTSGGNTCPLSGLSILPQVLPALRIAPNSNTLFVDNTLLLDSVLSPNINYSSLSNNGLTITDETLLTTNSIDSKNILLNDNANSIQLQLSNDVNINAEPFIRMTNNIGYNNYYYGNSINADSNNNFTFNNNESFFKQNNAFSYLTYKANEGDSIEKNYSFIYCYQLSGIKLYGPTHYLDDNGNDGWSCIISNHHNLNMNIDTSDFDWYSRNSGQQNNPIIISKWTTCRITLIYNPSVISYIWAVSQF